MYSSSFSSYYDRLMGDTSSITETTKKLLDTYVPENGSVLEIGCGTGTILQSLTRTSFRLSGLDNAEGMLKVARKKVPRARFFLGEMQRFNLKQQFNAVICIFDTINHLTKKKDWESLFRSVRRHMQPGGIFIFDTNTPKRLDTLATMPAYIAKLDKNTLACVRILKEKKIYTARFQIFENILEEKTTCLEEQVQETTFPTTEIEKMLKPHFTVLKKVDPIRKRVTAQTGRIFYVCQAK